MDISRELFELISGSCVERTENSLNCALCNYKSTKDLSLHYRTHINDILECPDCSLVLKDLQEFQEHIKEHDSNPNLICHPKLYDIKSMGFEDDNTKDLLTFDSIIEDFNESAMDLGPENDQVDEDQQLFNCDICNKSFKKLKSLEKHLKIHSTEVKYRCKYCNIEFLLKTSLRIHLKKHEGQENLLHCSICNIPYVNESDLKVHTRKTHPDEKLSSIKCAVCQKTFKKKCDLRKHQKIHDQNFRPHSCFECGKTFVHLTSLRNHSNTHAAEKKHQCSFCGQFFSFRGNLKVHIRSKHFPDQKDFACNFCDKRFSRSSYLKEHINTHTKDKFNKCNECGKSFTSSSTLSKHKKIHLGVRNFICVVCQKSFLQSSHLKKHSKIHTNEKSYFCSICNKYFRRSDTLAIHKKIHEKQKVESGPSNLNQEIIISSQIIIPPINLPDSSDFFQNQQTYQISYQIPENWNQSQL